MGIALLYEMIFNNVPFQKLDVIFVMGIQFTYGIVNFIVTIKTGNPPYPIIDYKTYMTFVYLASVTCLTIIGFFLGYLFSNYKK